MRDIERNVKMLTSAKDARESIEKEKLEMAKRLAEEKKKYAEFEAEFREYKKSREAILKRTTVLQNEWVAEQERKENEKEEARRRAIEEEKRRIKKYQEEQKRKLSREEILRDEHRKWFEQQVKYAIKCCNSSFTYITLSDRFTEDSMDLIIDEIKAAGYIVKKEFINHDDDPEFDSTFGTKEMRYTFIIPE